MTEQYQKLLREIVQNGESIDDRTGTGTLAIHGHTSTYNLQDGFPLLTTKDMTTRFEKIFHELKWFLIGDTNIKYLLDRNVNIWNKDCYRWYLENAKYEEKEPLEYEQFIHKLKTDSKYRHYGNLGNIYGYQWNKFGGSLNQIDEVINEAKTNPNSRRLVVSAWNPKEFKSVALPPCHVMFQLNIIGNKVHMMMIQRSGDVFLGVPFNIASYSLLLHMIAHVLGYEVGNFVHVIGNAHIYKNHLEQVQKQLKRIPLPLPKLKIKRKVTDIRDFEFSDFELEGYQCHSELKGSVSVGLKKDI